MRTKSIADFCKQTERIRFGYGWKTRREKWDYDRFMAICRKIEEIEHRYIRAIGKHQREAEGITREQQARDWESICQMQYPASVYMAKPQRI